MCLVAALPDVRWVLPDSYVVDGDSGYGGLVCCSSYILVSAALLFINHALFLLQESRSLMGRLFRTMRSIMRTGYEI